jgi:cysteamine dioxygenase
MMLGENANCTLVMFTFNTRHEHGRLPLHDHPGMHGIMRVLSGHVRVRTYTPIVDSTASQVHVGDIIDAQYNGDEVCALEHTVNHEQVLTPSSLPRLLHPCTHNIHSIEPIDTDAPTTAMLDVLMPSYANYGDACGYYEQLVNHGDTPDSIVKLRRIPPPGTYWSHPIPPPYTVNL